MKLNIRELKERGAAIAGEHRAEARSLVLLYCGVLALLALGSTGLDLFLSSRIDTTGGLDGMGLRTMLQTIQMILTYVNQFFGPFWSAGFLFAMIAMVRGRAPEQRDLTEGFRRPLRVLSYIFFQIMAAVLLLVATVNVASIIFSLLPMGRDFSAQYGEVLSDPNLMTPEGMINTDLIDVAALGRDILPMLVLTLLIYLPIFLRMTYSFRMAMYLILDRPIGAFPAHFLSMALMRGHKWSLAKLDLSFWWYYLLLAVCFAAGAVLLFIPVALDPMVMFFAALAVCFALFTLLSLWKKSEVDATYALAFEEIANAARANLSE